MRETIGYNRNNDELNRGVLKSKNTFPDKYCKYCNSKLERKKYNGRYEDLNRFLKREFCNLTCFGMSLRKETPSKSALYKRIRKFRKETCELCGSNKNLGNHHRDMNKKNNSPENLITLCDSCHTKWHWEHGKKVKRKQSDCTICGGKPKGYNLCQKHYQRLKKYGNPKLTKINSNGVFVLVESN